MRGYAKLKIKEDSRWEDQLVKVEQIERVAPVPSGQGSYVYLIGATQPLWTSHSVVHVEQFMVEANR